MDSIQKIAKTDFAFNYVKSLSVDARGTFVGFHLLVCRPQHIALAHFVI